MNKYILACLLYFMFGLGCQQKYLKKKACYLNMLPEFKSDSLFKDYIETKDSEYIYLKYLNKEQEPEQALVFNDSLKLIEYVFYNTALNEPRFIITYTDNDSIHQEGDPVYFMSKCFNSDRIATDTFSVYIYAATPPNCKTTVSIYEQKEERNFPVEINHSLSNTAIMCFIGQSDKQHKNYLVTSEIYDTCRQFTVRRDTSSFSIN